MATTHSFKSEKFPVGTTVAVYPATAKKDDGAPSGSSVTSAVVAADGSVSFTGLADATNYTAYALVSGQHRFVGFNTSEGATVKNIQRQPAIAVPASPSASYVQAEMVAIRNAQAQIIAALKAAGITS